MIDREKVMQRHIHNLKKSAGLHGNGSIKYEYIYTAEELEDAMLKRMDDLGYPLRVEPKRDRFVMNKSALKDAIIKASEKALNEFQHQIFVFVKNDVGDMLEREAYVI